LRCGKLIDVRSGKTLTDQVVVFDDNGIITAVSAAGSAQIPAGANTIDLSKSTCLPGLIDVHTHITSDPENSGYKGLGVSVPREAVTGVKNAKRTAEAGFTTVRNVGANEFTDVAVRDGINGARNHRRTL
jgi:imidazolonepropionase-like amidohydrolase